MNKHKFDFLVLGSGLAGLATAYYASEYGSVGLVTKSTLETSSSFHAQGGIAAVIDENDSLESHYNDTLVAGVGLCKKEAVKILVSDGSNRVKELIEMGMQFDKVNGKLALGLEGAHSHNRVLHADGDATGKKIVEFMASKVKEKKNISIFENTFVFNLLVENNRCNGFVGYNYLEKEEICFLSFNTMLASGGASAIYNRSTNPKSSTGDGIFLAYEAGAEIAGMEFIQFHPSSLVTNTGETYLISEAVRGEGAFLVNSNGKRFMLGKHPKAELAPRDFVAYEIYKEWQKPNNKVYLSLTHLNAEKMRKRFHNINLELKKYGLDIATDLIPVAPAAHYMIGGVKSGVNGETNINGLFVAGEVASTGVHGANRLASNSLLECLVFSKRAVEYAQTLSKETINISPEKCKFHINENLRQSFITEKENISKLIFKYAGIVRNKEDLIKFNMLLNKTENSFNLQQNEYYGFQLKSIITVAKLITNAALHRKESRGAHKRSDFPHVKKKFFVEIIQQKGKQTRLEQLKQ
jgi:L-aspartate oxidase